MAGNTTSDRSPALDVEAAYGCFPFDMFALENWDYSVPLEDDEQQWNDLVQKFLSLPEPERLPWRQRNALPGQYHPHLVPENIDRVLRPYQTVQERNICAHVIPACDNFIWLRTCYIPELQGQYEELLGISGAEDDLGVGRPWILDDAKLYDFGSDRDTIVTRIAQRMPSLCDSFPASVIEDYEQLEENLETGDETELEKASHRVRSVLCVIDEEAINNQVIKLFWLGPYGKCLWHNQIEPGELQEITGTFRGSFTLVEAIWSFGTEGERG